MSVSYDEPPVYDIAPLYHPKGRKTTNLIFNSTEIVLQIVILFVEWSVKSVDFGRKLKELRTQAKMTQAQLAARIGVTKSVISFYELQERAPSPDVLRKYARIFHVSADYLLGLDETEKIDVSDLSKDDIAILRAMAESLRRKDKG